MARFPLPWPYLGVSEFRAHADQPELSTSSSFNCRTLIGDTLRHQGGQRSGWSNFTSAPMEPGKHVDALVACTVDLPKVEFTGPDAKGPEFVWGDISPGKRACLDIQIGRNGDIFVLDENGTFRRLGPDGKTQTKVSFYVPYQEVVVPRIELDSSGNVYVASSHPDGYSSRVYRYERIEPEDDADRVFYNKSWNWAGAWGIRDFRVSGGSLYLSRYFSAFSPEITPADLQVVGQLSLTTPTLLYASATPGPVSTIAVNDQGEVLVSCKANDRRTQILGDEEWNVPVVAWSPHEIEDVAGYLAARRLHAWVDAHTLLDTHIDGSFVSFWRDRRWVDTSLDLSTTTAISESDGVAVPSGVLSYIPPTDTQARPVVRLQIDPDPDSPPPVFFKPQGAGSSPAVEFSGGSLQLMGNGGAGGLVKTDTDGDGFPNDDGLLPLDRRSIPSGPSQTWAKFFVVRINPRSDRSEGLWQFNGKLDGQLLLAVNGSKSQIYGGDSLGATEGAITFAVTTWEGNPKCENATGTAGGTYRIASCDLLNDGTDYGTNPYDVQKDFKNPQNIAIICISNDGSVSYPGVLSSPATYGTSLFRVNGRTVDRFSMVPDVLGDGGQEYLGSSSATWTPSSTLDNKDQIPLGAFRGQVLEQITILGSTAVSTKPNQVGVSWPGKPSGALAPAAPGAAHSYTDMSLSFTTYFVDPQAYTNFASEIERMEGYLAHKWGVDHVLPGGMTMSISGAFQNRHPFGRDASNSPVPPVGSPVAGGYVPGPSASALSSPKELLLKLGANGEVTWAIDGGGHGLGVASGTDGAVFAMGSHDKVAGSVVVAKRIKDLGSQVVTSGEGTWEIEDVREPTSKPVYGASVDDANNLYWPRRIAPYEVRQQFPTNVLVSQVFRTGAYSVVKREYVFSTAPLTQPLAGSGIVRVALGPTASKSLQNLAAAINLKENGGSDEAYYREALLDGPDKYVSGAYETESGSDYFRWKHRGFNGLAKLVSGSTTAYPYTELPPDTLILFPTWNIEFGGDSTSRLEMRSAEDGRLVWERLVDSGNSGGAESLACALDPNLPLYPNGSPLEGIPEYVYSARRENVDQLGELIENPDNYTLEKVRQVHRKQIIGKDLSPRKTFLVGASGGKLFSVRKGAKPSAYTSSIGLLSDGSPFTGLLTYRQKVYGFDGMKYVVFDPKTGKAEEWKADGAGEIPFGAKLGCVWNGRIVLARTPDDPHNLYMSERGNPLGWDRSPPVLTPLSAWSGDSSGTLHFKAHGLVNCLIPLRDDLLLVGQDSAVHRLTGDPGGQGQLDLLMEGEGLAFGRCWAQGPGGTAYAKGTNGGIWRFRGDGSFDRISLGWVEKRLQEINLAYYDVEMAWDFRQEGLVVVVVPKDVGGRIVEHFFWDGLNESWWPDRFSDASLQPTCISTLDADSADDRVVIIGCEDGYVRYSNPEDANDGGQRIVSEVVLGPYNLKGQGRVSLSKLEMVLASRYEGCLVEVFATDVADFGAAGSPVYSGEISSGYVGWLAARATGNHLWIKLSNGAQDERWALEEATMIGRRAGRRRVR